MDATFTIKKLLKNSIISGVHNFNETFKKSYEIIINYNTPNKQKRNEK